jgi:hypothetical protein
MQHDARGCSLRRGIHGVQSGVRGTAIRGQARRRRLTRRHGSCLRSDATKTAGLTRTQVPRWVAVGSGRWAMEVMTEPVSGASETGRRQARTRIGEIPSAPPDATQRSWRSWFVCSCSCARLFLSVHLFILGVFSHPSWCRIQAASRVAAQRGRHCPQRVSCQSAGGQSWCDPCGTTKVLVAAAPGARSLSGAARAG